jgi:hypothetical protein
MPVERGLIEETVVSDADRVDNAMNNSNDNKDTILPVNAWVVVRVTDIDDRSNELSKAKVCGSNSDSLL